MIEPKMAPVQEPLKSIIPLRRKDKGFVFTEYVER